jgi:hypothetical protein
MGHARTWAVVVILASVGGPASAQIPERFTNLQVLPKDTSRKDLVWIMRGWASALGIRCGHCHVGGNPDTLEGVDFASDEKWEKRTARGMAKMVRALDEDYMQRLESRPLSANAQPEPKVAVSCATCHRGLRRPETLDVLLGRIVRTEGADAAVRTYKDLRKEYLGRGSYDFSERPLNTVAESLMQEKRTHDAALLLEMGAEFNPDAAWLRHLLGDALLAEGDRKGALAAYERALALSPENTLTRKKLDELKAREPAR